MFNKELVIRKNWEGVLTVRRVAARPARAVTRMARVTGAGRNTSTGSQGERLIYQLYTLQRIAHFVSLIYNQTIMT